MTPDRPHRSVTWSALDGLSLMVPVGTALGLLGPNEQSAANGIPIREAVCEEPVEFAEVFLRNYRTVDGR